jgi:hypothetical protein
LGLVRTCNGALRRFPGKSRTPRKQRAVNQESVMSIAIETRDTSVTNPMMLELVNHSGANVEVFVFIGSRFDASHAFDFEQSAVEIPVTGLSAGPQLGVIMVRAEKNLNRMYSVLAMLNGEIVALADGNIETEDGKDSGVDTFTVTVGGAQ